MNGKEVKKICRQLRKGSTILVKHIKTGEEFKIIKHSIDFWHTFEVSNIYTNKEVAYNADYLQVTNVINL